MKNSVRKFLEFNGKVIFFVAVDGTYWIAIKPICEALGIEYTRTFKNIKSDTILRDVLAKQPMRDTKNRLQEMVSLPEKYIYGWLFSIRSGSDAFQDYKRKCYDVLYEYFHGSITRRHQALMKKTDALAKLEEIEESLVTYPEFREWNETRARIMRIGKELKNIDEQMINGQLKLDLRHSN
jgi:hypothetical protein